MATLTRGPLCFTRMGGGPLVMPASFLAHPKLTILTRRSNSSSNQRFCHLSVQSHMKNDRWDGQGTALGSVQVVLGPNAKNLSLEPVSPGIPMGQHPQPHLVELRNSSNPVIKNHCSKYTGVQQALGCCGITPLPPVPAQVTHNCNVDPS